ncbi:MAG TPA: TVP38/TMEM64 family protein [Vicinamibacterales bacterium]|nr:TVP38/TMEM64 family protein [Vicinamibacterales bacterium]
MNDVIERVVLALAELGPWAPVLFILAYIAAAVTLAPAFLLTLAAGAVFGLWRGTVLVYIGAVLGSSAVFAIASPLSRSRFLRWLDRDPRVAAVRSAVVGEGVWVMFLLRLSPVVPFVLLNYALALSGVRYRDFLIASVGMFPAIVMYVYYGKVAGDVAKLAAGITPPRGPEYYVLLVVGLVATIVATTAVTRAARRAMKNTSGSRTAEE